MEPIFWLLFNGGIAVFIFVILAGIVIGIVNSIKYNRLAEEYIGQGLITKAQKSRLFDVLLEKGREALAADLFGKAYRCFSDCLKIAEWGDDGNQKKAVNYEFARYYAAKEEDQKALNLLSGIFTPHAYLLKGELLARQDKIKNRAEIQRCAKEADKCEELRSRAVALFSGWDGYVDGRISAKTLEHQKKMRSLFNAMTPIDLSKDIAEIRKDIHSS